jgi:hypothetical protein
MKFNTEHSKATVSGAVSAPQTFTIQTSKAMFLLLSSALYSNKIAACIRELSCNAYDAHVAADKREVPFEIHLPTSFEPWVSVKDYGVGLEHGEAPSSSNNFKGKGVLGLYCSYGGTTKSDSNKEIGCFGVGSKSPFCYTEGFTVISRFEGTTRIYSAFITEQGTPSVVLQTEAETPDAVNGLEVTFPVKESDCWEFENNAKIVLSEFDPAPVVSSTVVAKYLSDLATRRKTTGEANSFYVMKTDRWGMRSEASTHQGSGMRAIQGMVQYAVGKIDISKMGPELQALTAMPLDLFFPIGELAVAASRETLQLDPITVANITKALEGVYTGLVSEVKKEIDKCKAPWEARLLIFKLITAPGTGKIINQALDKGELFGVYSNFTLAEKKPTVNELDYFHTQVYRFKKNGRSAKWGSKSNVFTRVTKGHRTLASMELTNGTKVKKDFNRDFDVSNDVAFVINDIKFGGEKYVHYFLQEAADNTTTYKVPWEAVTDGDKVAAKTIVYLFSRANKDHTPAQVMREATAMLAALGNPPVMLMSELKTKYSPLCDIKAAKGAPKEKRDILELDLEAKGRRRYGSRLIYWCNAWKRSDSQPNGVKYYVVVEETKATECGFEKAADLIEFVKNVQNSEKFGLDASTPVYGLKTKSPLRLLTTEWVELTSHVFTQVPKIMTRSKELELSLKLKPFYLSYWNGGVNAVAADSLFSPTSPMKKFADSFTKAQRYDNPGTEALIEILDIAKKRLNPITQQPYYEVQAAVNFGTAWEETSKLYPMIYDTRCSSVREVKIFKEYVQLVDTINTQKEQDGIVATVGMEQAASASGTN